MNRWLYAVGVSLFAAGIVLGRFSVAPKRGLSAAVAFAWQAPHEHPPIMGATRGATAVEDDDEAEQETAQPSWTLAEIEQEIARIAKLASITARGEALEALIEHLRPEDAEAALALGARLEPPRLRQHFEMAAIDVWARLAPEDAVSRALELRPMTLARAASRDALFTWLMSDAAGAADWLEGLPANDPLRRATGSLVQQFLSEEDPERAFAFAQDLGGREGAYVLSSALETWAAKEPSAARAAYEAMPESRAKDEARTGLLSGLCESNPDVALSFAREIDQPEARGEALDQIVLRCEATSPAFAAKMFASLSTADKTGELAASVAMRLAAEDPDAALKWVAELEPATRSAARDAVINELSSQDPERAFQLALSRDDSGGTDEERDLVAEVATSWAESAPEEAFAALASIQADDSRARARESVLSQWADSDPESAAAAAWALPSGDERRQGLAAVARTWAMQDGSRALAWLSDLPGSSERDHAVAAAAFGLGWEAHEGATELIETMRDPASRRAAAEGFAATWSEKDPAAAANWLVSSRVADDELVAQYLLSWQAHDPDGMQAFIASPNGAVAKKKIDAAQQESSREEDAANAGEEDDCVCTCPSGSR